MTAPTPEINPAWVEAAALAISIYDWDHGLSANGEVSQHQRAEAVAALTAAAPLIAARAAEAARERIAEAIDDATDQHGIYGDWYGGMGEAAEIARRPAPDAA